MAGCYPIHASRPADLGSRCAASPSSGIAGSPRVGQPSPPYTHRAASSPPSPWVRPSFAHGSLFVRSDAPRHPPRPHRVISPDNSVPGPSCTPGSLPHPSTRVARFSPHHPKEGSAPWRKYATTSSFTASPACSASSSSSATTRTAPASSPPPPPWSTAASPPPHRPSSRSASARRSSTARPPRPSPSTSPPPSPAASPPSTSPRPTSSTHPRSSSSISPRTAAPPARPSTSPPSTTCRSRQSASSSSPTPAPSSRRDSAVVSAQDPHQWTYTTTAAAPSNSVKIVVDVADLAGQITEETKHT